MAQALAFFFKQDIKIETSSNSGGSPVKILTRHVHPPPHTAVLVKGGIHFNNRLLACTPKGEPTTEESLRFDRDLEALDESEHHTKDDVFAKEMAAYGQPRDEATQFLPI